MDTLDSLTTVGPQGVSLEPDALAIVRDFRGTLNMLIEMNPLYPHGEMLTDMAAEAEAFLRDANLRNNPNLRARLGGTCCKCGDGLKTEATAATVLRRRRKRRRRICDTEARVLKTRLRELRKRGLALTSSRTRAPTQTHKMHSTVLVTHSSERCPSPFKRPWTASCVLPTTGSQTHQKRRPAFRVVLPRSAARRAPAAPRPQETRPSSGCTSVTSAAAAALMRQ